MQLARDVAVLLLPRLNQPRRQPLQIAEMRSSRNVLFGQTPFEPRGVEDESQPIGRG